jgi:hypothetical protein
MRLRIQGGTVQDGESSLCLTCRHATVIQGPALGDRIVDCGRLVGGPARIPFPVRSCTAHSDKRQPSVYEMEDIAWVLRTDARKNHIGFVRARDLKPRDRPGVLPDEWEER